ncbi:unnamed protein product [Lathyrus sativus]|nr:unnamed protein product [Lathyrus sativus]
MMLQPLFPTNNSYESKKLSENTKTTYQCDGKNQKEDSNTYLVIGQSVQVDAKFPNSRHEFFPAATTGNMEGAQLRDGEAPNAIPSHSKLHQLLLEERIENGYSNPARLVKLKKRQLNGPAVEAKSGKSYMEKFLETPSPDPKMIYETSIFPLSVKPTPDDSSEVGIKILEISIIKKSIGDENSCSSPYEPESELHQFLEEVGEAYGDLVMVKEQISVGVRDVKVFDETKLTINEQKKIKGSLVRYNSDDVTSEVDNYMDALTTMESDNNNSFSGNEDEHVELQAHFSDSQSTRKSFMSDVNIIEHCG